MKIRQCPSPNFGERKAQKIPRFVVLHFTAMVEVEDAIERLASPLYEVSAHYVISKSGEIIQMVDEAHRAWHSGQSFWAGEYDINSASIGIELDNNGARPFDEQIYESLEWLLADIKSRHDIEAILGHDMIAIERKFDPGPWFDWRRFDERGLTALPKSTFECVDYDENEFRQLAAKVGFQSNVDFNALLRVVRIRNGVGHLYNDLSREDFNLLLK